MRGLALAAAAFAAIAAPAAEQARSSTFHADDPSGWGRVTRLVEPKYPAAALRGKRSGHVDVSGRVTAQGLLEQVTYSPDRPASGVFIDPIRRVIREWRFVPPLERLCQPTGERVTNRVSFGLEAGKPRIAVSLRARPGRPPPMLAPLRREEPAVPRAGAPVPIYARTRLDENGNVVSVEPRSYPPRGATGVREIEHEVIRALAQWKFPASGEPGANRFVCHAVRPGG